MQPNDIFAPDSAYSPDPEKINGEANEGNNESINIEYPLESMSFEYMIWTNNEESEESNLNSIMDSSTSISTRPNNVVRKDNRKANRNRNIDFSSFDKDGSTKDLNPHNADILIKYMTILLKDAEQKQRAIKRLQAEFDKKSKEVANLKDIYEKLKRKR
ncbi:uncharacterized protein LOC129609604 [Condylostylus longicornis]|uniref:uncharacterized protein LOC129609604 n=1 Tax=Condylostylus longicornis TaxID=2530218 RepID=UPI00244DED83|nr:uncharacterized protein LOC129609604 [Condylostylus longicornis]